ncbi:MAG: TonB-dependent receptor plug domain-containing protein [Bacteroides sp.]|nr:TonB-dependent receptor plug domain-containing protein [Bacteroides sp.]MCM1412890.1 TonB-dependent receptor plug domain-containing protein [Bacteroides sp.]MCM1471559.1 TonB-dependent receptor plug domain-containing protein [Bacteroides sp.]
MKRILSTIIISLTALLTPCVSAQSRVRHLGEVTAWGRRPMKDIGVQKTTFDSIALKENISLSMADVLTFNSSVFVKSYGRATLSTVAFRGTSPSHTQVTWNGMRINNPMLGMTDFSTIPSYFIDQATMLHGTSSVNETGGGLGGLVSLSTSPEVAPGLNMQYVQGIGSFSTFDEFLRIGYSDTTHWATSTRFVYSSSPNDYKYTNHDKRINIYDDDHNIIGSYNPTERNRSGAYKDMHLLQEVYYTPRSGDRIGLNAWFINSNRELPMLTTDYGDERDFENRQRERTFRSILSWEHTRSNWKTTLRGGYVNTWMAYDYRREVAENNWASMTRSRSRINTVYGQAEGQYSPTRRWLFNASFSAHQQFVKSRDKNIILQNGQGNAVVGYDNSRIELSGSLSARWQPNERLGFSAVVREEMYGRDWAPVIPAFFADFLLSPKGNLLLKASVTRNHRFPTLNDLYFLPGGNPNLKSESGFTYDAGLSFEHGFQHPFATTLSGSVTWFDSHIDDWIIWLPTTKGFFSPRNVKEVHAYGIEARLSAAFEPFKGWVFDINGSYSWTPSINRGTPMSPADQSVGRQLPYVPRHSASLTGRVEWKGWNFLYKWAYYSQRFTMSSNDYTITGHLPQYFMSNIALGKDLHFRPVDLQLKLAVNNLFNEDYLSVLSRPMPGINFEAFIGISFKAF